MKNSHLVRRVLHYLNLEPELDDFDRIDEQITRDSQFKGSNLWILMAAIVLASVGLNVNSTAVIIGAMLISPLMGPINGIGYSIATYNPGLFLLSIRHFSFAVLVSLTASTLYFIISPISTAHSELLARTSPTIYDVVIALFGGLAGIIAISSRIKGNVIPGVAIATALMPPLCTAGYGLATGKASFFFGALYLFTINTVFIALASVIISQVLKFPIRAPIAQARKARINQWITAVIVLVTLPSLYFGWGLVLQERFNDRANRFINQVRDMGHWYLLSGETNPSDESIVLTYAGPELSDDLINRIEQEKVRSGLEKANVKIKQGFTVEGAGILTPELAAIRAEVHRLEQLVRQTRDQSDSLQMVIQKLDSYKKAHQNSP